MSPPVKGFIKLAATLLVPTVIIGALTYVQRGVWWGIIGGVVGLVAGGWAIRETYGRPVLRRRSNRR